MNDRRRRMLDAGIQLFGDRGFTAVSITDICGQARVSRRSFYEEFAGLDRLLMSIVDEKDMIAVERVAASLAASTGEHIQTRAARAFEAFLSATCPDRLTARVCFVEVVRVADTVEAWRRERRRRLAALLVFEAESAAQRGEIAPGSYEFAVIAVVGAVTYAIQEWTESAPIFGEFTDMSITRLAERLAQIFLACVDSAAAQR
ncbi:MULTISPECIES: TetR/AcrR family transcriptional regulator [unclassified Nocardia]|uniref:TetR/AcrR family transcriptional regulator n=1 Tax=unclassified Nocardia TaxID=2637762 RepID=UPI001CE3D34F|nr:MULTISPECIES: TetR/AcrR family transcriptional regulator [unclassified Nocardia]